MQKTRVKSLKDPNVTVLLSGKFYKFTNGYAEIPTQEAVKLTQSNLNYQLEGQITHHTDLGFTRFNPKTWTKDYKKIIVDIPLGFWNGYGKAAQMMVTGLVRKGVDVRVINAHWSANTKEHLPKEVTEAMAKEVGELDSYYIKYFPASAFDPLPVERYVGFSMFEASLVHPSWAGKINANLSRLVVPSTQNKKMFEDSGVLRDIEVTPIGLDLDLFPVIDRPERDEFVFGIMGGLTYRKGPDVLVKAFKKAFHDKPDAKLYIKTIPAQGITYTYYLTQDELLGKNPQILLRNDVMSPEKLIKEFFAEIDCFVFPTRGEGFGLPPIEAMATGLPVIATSWGGTADFMRSMHAYPLKYKLVDVPEGDSYDQNMNLLASGHHPDHWVKGSKWAEPDVDHLAELMLDVYNNRRKAKTKGERASEYVRKHFSCERAAEQLIDYLDRKF